MQVLLQTAEMSFFNFSISPSFSFIEFNNCNETKVSQRIPTSAYKKSEVTSELLDHKQWRNMELLGFVRKLLFASVLRLKTTCRELNLPSFRIFSLNLLFYKIPNASCIERPTDRPFKYKLKHSSSIYVQPCICIDANFFANVNCKTFRFLLVMYDCETRLVHYCLWCGEVVRESFFTSTKVSRD